MWLEESEQGLGRGVREEVRRVMGGKVKWSLKVHFKNFDFELKAIKTQHTAVSQEAMTERINTFSSTYVHGWTKDSTFCIICINNWGGACVRFPVTVWEMRRDFICGSVLGFYSHMGHRTGPSQGK